MNAGIVFGFKREREVPVYFDVLLTGTELLVEQNDWSAGSKWSHITAPVPFEIKTGVPYAINVVVDDKRIEIRVNNGLMQTLERPSGVWGRVGLRPWRSKMDCTKFIVRLM
jgi:hypothetical protein